MSEYLNEKTSEISLLQAKNKQLQKQLTSLKIQREQESEQFQIALNEKEDQLRQSNNTLSIMPSSDANELVVQNQELQKQIKKLKKQLTNQVKTGLKEPESHDDYDQLKEENEELKQQMD